MKRCLSMHSAVDNIYGLLQTIKLLVPTQIFLFVLEIYHMPLLTNLLINEQLDLC